MRTKNPAEEFGVAQYSDGRTGREAERTASRVGGRSFNLRPRTVRAGTLTRYTALYLHNTRAELTDCYSLLRAVQPLGQLGEPPPCQGLGTWSQNCHQDPMKSFWIQSNPMKNWWIK